MRYASSNDWMRDSSLVLHELDELLDVRVPRIDVGPLEDAGEEARLPVLRLLQRVAAGAHRDEARKVLVLRAQPVSDPTPDARADLPRLAAVHEEE